MKKHKSHFKEVLKKEEKKTLKRKQLENPRTTIPPTVPSKQSNPLGFLPGHPTSPPQSGDDGRSRNGKRVFSWGFESMVQFLFFGGVQYLLAFPPFLVLPVRHPVNHQKPGQLATKNQVS